MRACVRECVCLCGVVCACVLFDNICFSLLMYISHWHLPIVKQTDSKLSWTSPWRGTEHQGDCLILRTAHEVFECVFDFVWNNWATEGGFLKTEQVYKVDLLSDSKQKRLHNTNRDRGRIWCIIYYLFIIFQQERKIYSCRHQHALSVRNLFLCYLQTSLLQFILFIVL